MSQGNKYQLAICGGAALPIFNTETYCFSDSHAETWAKNILKQLTGREFYRFFLYREEKLIAQFHRETEVVTHLMEEISE